MNSGPPLFMMLSSLVLSLTGGLTAPGLAQDAKVGTGIANTGTQTFHGSVTIGPSGAQIQAIVQATLRRDSLNAQRATVLDKQVANLSKEIGVRRPAIENFLRILGEAQVPIESLNAKLAEIARRHLDLLARQSVPEEEADPAVHRHTDVVKAAIDDGDYDRADRLLAKAEERDLAAARQAREPTAQTKEAADRRRLSAAAKRAERGELRLIRFDYLGAAKHFERAAELVPASSDSVLADYLTRAGSALLDAGKYREAEPFLRRALTIREQTLGAEHPDLARALDNLAQLYYEEGRYAEAEPLYERALAISERVLGSEHPDVAQILNNLALLYHTQGRYAEIEPLYKRALAISERALGPDHPDLAATLNNLALLYEDQDRYAEAEPLYKRALAISERALGPDHPEVAATLTNLAGLYESQGRYAQAESLYKRALAISERALGPEHPDLAIILDNLAGLYENQGRPAEAEALCKRALAISERALGPEHPDLAVTLGNLGGLYEDQDRYAEAEPLYKRALAISERALEPDHPDLAAAMDDYAAILEKLGRNDEADQWAGKAEAIRQRRGKEKL